MPELVNQPFQPLKWWPQMLVACNCQKEQGTLTLLVLTGLQNRTQCEHCKKSYYIAGFIQGKSGPECVAMFDLPTSVVM